MVDRVIGEERLNRYFDLAERALASARDGFDEDEEADDLFSLAERYVEDARHWREEGELVLAYGSLNFAHGLLDAGVRTDVFDAYDPEVFTQD